MPLEIVFDLLNAVFDLCLCDKLNAFVVLFLNLDVILVTSLILLGFVCINLLLLICQFLPFLADDLTNLSHAEAGIFFSDLGRYFVIVYHEARLVLLHLSSWHRHQVSYLCFHEILSLLDISFAHHFFALLWLLGSILL